MIDYAINTKIGIYVIIGIFVLAGLWLLAEHAKEHDKEG